MKKLQRWMAFHPPRSATMDGWNRFHAKFKEEAPIRYFFSKTCMRFLRRQHMRIRDAVWAVKYRTMQKHKYHLVDTGLSPGYYDTDYRMLHAMFSLLCEYVEHNKEQLEFSVTLGDPNSENYDPICDPNSSEFHHYQALNAKEVLEIYHWWTEERDREYKEVDVESDEAFDMLYEAAGKDIFKMFDDDFQEKHPELVKRYRERSLSRADKEEILRLKDNEMLKRLIDVRSSLW